ncbi:MarR family transcriptional regulator [Rhizobium sp. AG855]|uniref:MarR family winged helix-turn-helix transcriptional regulator n=1 Tax=Rhizobium sp. AG855 TaxID=2183898 RepID=UPI000E751E06|nr:MarR family transcriptional regulator [Rhizobium sp. AG855]RKE85653.1 MarR family transcriptional regulator [Rhizobium sp. AG855]
METPERPLSITVRILEGLARMAMVNRVDDWNRAKALGLNPTQLAILVLLEGRHSGMSVKDISAHLGVSQPTATDSVLALERKGLVLKQVSETDKRGLAITITREGLSLLSGEHSGTLADRAVASLTDDEQQDLLLALIKMIRSLQAENAIPVQRMCVSCRFFAPFAHAGSAQPHHCHLVDAAFGQRDLRVDCREHEPADPASQAATWQAFQKG